MLQQKKKNKTKKKTCRFSKIKSVMRDFHFSRPKAIFSIMYVDDYSHNIYSYSYLIFKCLMCDSRSLKWVFKMVCGAFSVVSECFGVFQWTQKG